MAVFGYIENIDDCLRCFDQAPENMLKICKTAARKAASATAKNIRRNVPATFKRIVSYSVKQGQVTRKTNALIGLFNKKSKKRGRKEVSDWFKAYWKNYGTSKRRDTSHQFQYAIRHDRDATKRNKEGQYPERFFEQAIKGWENIFVDAFAKSLKEQENKLYDR